MKKFRYSEITPEKIYNKRRSFIKSIGYGLELYHYKFVPLINATKQIDKHTVLKI